MKTLFSLSIFQDCLSISFLPIPYLIYHNGPLLSLFILLFAFNLNRTTTKYIIFLQKKYKLNYELLCSKLISKNCSLVF